MIPLQLRTGVSFCLFEDCTIVLDIKADRYWRLDRPAGETLLAVRNGDVRHLDAARVARLVALDFVSPSGGRDTAAPPPNLPPPIRSALDDDVDRDAGQIAAGVAVRVGWQSLAAHIAVRMRPLDNLVSEVTRPLDRSGGSASGVARLATEFRRHRRLMPLPTLCLPDSLALLAFAARHGHYPHLVFGVAAEPFTAHCWLQSADTVLNDTLDHVSVFTPILVV